MNPEPDRAWSACRINLKPQIHKEFSSFDGFFAGYPLPPGMTFANLNMLKKM